ncbi:MAG: hypothetical protein WKF86_10145, partial [Acidimicrobiales bacterium]
ATILARPPVRLDLPLGRQGEALSFSRNGGSLWATSEGAGSPLILAPLPSAGEQPDAAVPAPAPVPDDMTQPERDLVAYALLAGGSGLLVGCTVLLLVRLRRGLRRS